MTCRSMPFARALPALVLLAGLVAPQAHAGDGERAAPPPARHAAPAGAATVAPTEARPLGDAERTELAALAAQAQAAALDEARGGEVDDHDVTLVLATVAVVVLVALLL